MSVVGEVMRIYRAALRRLVNKGENDESARQAVEATERLRVEVVRSQNIVDPFEKLIREIEDQRR